MVVLAKRRQAELRVESNRSVRRPWDTARCRGDGEVGVRVEGSGWDCCAGAAGEGGVQYERL